MFWNNKKTIVTHSGTFHADDVFAVAILSKILDGNFKLVRTRDKKLFESADFVVDVGGTHDAHEERFDHHQGEGAGTRKNGIAYASAGLVWNKYGEQICGSQAVASKVDERLIQVVDATDNGLSISKPIFEQVFPYTISDMVASFVPGIFEDENTADSQFQKALSFAKNILDNEIKKAGDQIYIEAKVKDTISNGNLDSNTVVFDEYMPRVPLWIELGKYPNILYAVAPATIDKSKWKLVAVPKDMSFFTYRKTLPSAWGAKNGKELQDIAGVADAEFCHKDLFLCIAGSKEGALKLMQKAVENI